MYFYVTMYSMYEKKEGGGGGVEGLQDYSRLVISIFNMFISPCPIKVVISRVQYNLGI